MTAKATYPEAAYQRDDRHHADRIRHGDYAGFEALYRAHYKGLFAFVLHYVRVPETAEELVQDLFLKLWQQRKDWDSGGNVKAYLYAAARNNALKHLRHRKVERWWQREAKREGEAVAESPEATLRCKEVAEAVQRAIEEMPERRRLVFTLSRYHHLSYAEIATALDLSVNTVENQMVRALKHLRLRLNALRSVVA